MALELRVKLNRLRSASQQLEQLVSALLADIDATVSAVEARAQADDIERPESAELLALYRHATKNTGLHADVLYAIWHHETGHGKSQVWNEANNPGGLKFHPEFPNLDHRYGSYVRPGGGVEYARFPDHATAVAAHVRFLQQKRYRNALNLTPLNQVKAIRDAGYIQADMADDWQASVTVLLGKIQAGKLA